MHIAVIFQHFLTFSLLWRTLATEILGYNVYWPKLDDDFSDKCWNSKLNWHQPTLQDCLRKIIDTFILSMNRLCNFQLSYFLLEVGNSRCIKVVLSEIRAIVGLEGEVVESIYFILAKLKINGHTLLLELNNGTLHF